MSVCYCEVNNPHFLPKTNIISVLILNVIHSLWGELKRTRDTEAPPVHTDTALAPVNQKQQKKRTETCRHHSHYTHQLEKWKIQMLLLFFLAFYLFCFP